MTGISINSRTPELDSVTLRMTADTKEKGRPIVLYLGTNGIASSCSGKKKEIHSVTIWHNSVRFTPACAGK